MVKCGQDRHEIFKNPCDLPESGIINICAAGWIFIVFCVMLNRGICDLNIWRDMEGSGHGLSKRLAGILREHSEKSQTKYSASGSILKNETTQI